VKRASTEPVPAGAQEREASPELGSTPGSYATTPATPATPATPWSTPATPATPATATLAAAAGRSFTTGDLHVAVSGGSGGGGGGSGSVPPSPTRRFPPWQRPTTPPERVEGLREQAFASLVRVAARVQKLVPGEGKSQSPPLVAFISFVFDDARCTAGWR